MANKILDGTDMIGEFLGKGKRFSDQTRYLKSFGTVKLLDMIGYPPLLFDDLILLFFNDTHGCLPSVCIKGRMSAVAVWY